MTLFTRCSPVAKSAVVSTGLSVLLALAGASHASAASFTPGNLVVVVAQSGTANNTTVNLQEFTPAGSTSGLQNVALSGTGTNAFRISGSAGTSCYISLSADQTLLTIPGANSTNTSSNENTLNPRVVATLNSATTVNLTGTYTGVSGNQERSATTLDNSNYYISDQGGLYTNGSTSASDTLNALSIRSFGGSVYLCSAKTSGLSPAESPVVLVPSPTATAYTTLPGVATDASAVDFYMISSGNNGTAYDILYVLSSSSGLVKYSLVGGTWVANGADGNATVKTGFGMAAASNGSGGVVFYMVAPAATAGNAVYKFTDQAGYNATINDTTPASILTSTSPNAFKSVAFAPLPVTISTTGTLTALSTTSGTASASTSFTISAVSLTNNITLTAPAGFEISTSSGSGYAGSLTLPESGGSVPSTTVYVRLAAADAQGTYSGPVTAVSSGVPTIYVPTASSTVSAGTSNPTVAATGTLTAMSTTTGTPSAAQSFTASGTNLTGNITITAPSGFEISTSSSSGYAGTLNLTPSGGTVPATTIFVRLAAADSVGNYSGNITLASSGATTVNEAIPSSTVSGSATLTGLTSSAGGFTQPFSPSTLNYTQYVAGSVTSVTLTPTAASGATVTVNAQSPSTAFPMSTGSNTLVVVVTNGGQNTTYTVNIIRAGAFTPGDLVVTTYGNLQTGPVHADGQGTLITLAEFSPTIAPNSTPVMAYTIPSAVAGSNVGMVGEYGSSSEGSIQQTPDGLYLTIGGYSAVPGLAYNATALAQSPCATVPRVGALIDLNTNANTSSVFNDIYNTNNTRCIFSPDGANIYLSGQGAGASDEGGLYYAPVGDNTTSGGAAPTGIYNVVSTRNLFALGGNLCYSCDQNSSSKGTQTGIFEYNGFPTTNAQGIGTRLTPASAGGVNYSPEGVWFANATTMYVADTGDPKAGGTGAGGLQKWVYNGSAWVLQYTLRSPNFLPVTSATSASSGETGLEAVTGTVTNGVATLYGCSYTAGDANPNGLYGVTDTLTATSSTATLTEIAAAPGIQSSGTNPDYNFKGVSFAPTGLPVNSQVASNVTSGGATLNASVNPQGTDTVAYFQYGTSPGALGSTTTQQDLGSGTSAVPFSAGLTGLQPGTIYYYQLVTVANGVTSTYAVQSFTTVSAPAETPTDTPVMPPAGLVMLALGLMAFAFYGTRRRSEA